MQIFIEHGMSPQSLYSDALHNDDHLVEFPQRLYPNFEGSFREAVWPVWVVGQIFGVLPVIGVSNKSISKLHFKWKSKRTIYSLTLAIILLVFISILLCTAFAHHGGIDAMDVQVFYIVNIFSFMCFLVLAPKWPRLVKFWTTTERRLPPFESFEQKRRFIFKVRSVAFGIFVFAIVEHFMDVADQIYLHLVCKQNTFLDHVKAYAPHMYTDNAKVSAYEAICIRLFCDLCQFVWSFLDVFLIFIGMALTAQFKQFNNELERIKGKHMPEDFWNHRRKQYNELCNLVQEVDKTIGHLILMSFFSNLFFVCKQLFQSLRPRPTTLSAVYFWLSLFFIILRSGTVSFTLSRINDESTKPKHILNALPTESWNVDTKRLFNDVTTYTISLTGMGFFSVTRSLVFSVLGIIVTYELVLLGFKRDNKDATLCNDL